MMIDFGVLNVDCGARSCDGACPRASSTINIQQSTFRRAFTLTEILVVIGIIVLMLAIAVPALNFIRGSRSVDSAQNQISALLGRARSKAIGLQELTGVFFFKDINTGRYMASIVHETAAQQGDAQWVEAY